MPSKKLLKFSTKRPLPDILDMDFEIPGVKTFFSAYKDPIGIEIEVENCTPDNGNISAGFVYWTKKSDGSLKDNGIEFVSIPLSGKHIDYAIHQISPIISKPELVWSHRTSIHVHLNVSKFTEADLQALVLLYALFENVLFSFVSPVRRNNPYCYKITSTPPEKAFDFLQETKYCALNISPIGSFCTVEMRHLHGTGDTKTIRRWVQLAVKLRHYVATTGAKNVIKEIDNAIINQDVSGLFKRVFGASTILFDNVNINELSLENSLWVATARSYLCVEFGG